MHYNAFMPVKMEISQLFAKADDHQILNGINLTINPGEIHALMGPNGSGKSTLAQVMMGHPDYEVNSSKSKIKIGKNNILDLKPDERAKAGLFLAFQHPISIPGVSVVNFLRTAYKHLFPENKEISALDFFKYLKKIAKHLKISEDLLKRSLNEGLSGGERKKMETLQMIALSPQFIILDELDTGTDVDALKLLGNTVASLMDEKAMNKLQLADKKYQKPGILLITHYNRIFKYVTPEFIHVIKKGKIVKTGDKELIELIEKQGYEQF